MLTSETVLSQILDENIIDAKKSIHALLAQKAKVYLEDKRRCIAAVTYGPCATAEAKGDCNCSCDEQVVEDCGCSEVEEMNANQKKLDKNHNGELDSQDFKILRGKKKKQVEEASGNTDKIDPEGYYAVYKSDGKIRVAGPYSTESAATDYNYEGLVDVLDGAELVKSKYKGIKVQKESLEELK